MTSVPAVTDRSKGGANYSSAATNWTTAAYGNAMIACNYKDAVQVTTSGAFADLTGTPPKAQLVACNLGFVMLPPRLPQFSTGTVVATNRHRLEV